MNEPLTQDEQIVELRQQVDDLEAECQRLRNALKNTESQLWHVRALMRQQGMEPREENAHAR